MSLNFKKVCRLCTQENDKLLPIFTDGEEGSMPSLPTKINTFAPKLKITLGDGLPDQVCEHCACQVDTSYKFKLQCESSDTTLRENLSSKKTKEQSTSEAESLFQSTPETESNPVIIDGEIEPRNRIVIKPEVKEEVFVDETNDQSEPKDGGMCDDFIESSNDTWPDFPAEPSSSKVVETNNIPKNKKPSPKNKVNTKRKKKAVKEETLGTETDPKLPIQDSSCINDTETVPLDHVKVEDSVVGKELNVKMRMKKNNYMKVFQCHDCGKNFAKKAQLVLHMSGHTGAKPYICNQCCRTFASRINLKKHLFTHTGEKPYLCTHCGIFFGRIDTLTKHMRSHTGEKPFNCNVCGNSFARRSTFTNHMRTHSGEKPYLCTECGWRCVQSYDLKKHMRCHTGEKPYNCSVCRMSFGQRNSLTKHMRCHIGEVPIPMECVKEMQFRCQVYGGTKEFNNFPIQNNQPVDGQVQ